MQKPPADSLAIAIIQELPTLVISTVLIIVVTILLVLHVMLTVDAMPIFYIVISYFLANGNARLVANKTMLAVTQATGNNP